MPRQKLGQSPFAWAIVCLVLCTVPYAVDSIWHVPTSSLLTHKIAGKTRIPLAFVWPDEAGEAMSKKKPGGQKPQQKPKPGSKQAGVAESTDPMEYLKATSSYLAAMGQQANKTAAASLKEASKVAEKVSKQFQDFLKQVQLQHSSASLDAIYQELQYFSHRKLNL